MLDVADFGTNPHAPEFGEHGVIAEALGFHHTTTHRQTIHAGGIWNRYAAPDEPAQRAEPRIRGK